MSSVIEGNKDAAELLSELIADCKAVDPRRIAAEIEPLIGSRHLRSVFRVTLVGYIRVELGKKRRASLAHYQHAGSACGNCGRRVLHAPECPDSATTQLHDRLEYLSILQDLLPQSVYVNRSWKVLGDCSEQEIREIAEDLRTTAERDLERAQQYEELADDLVSENMETLAKLFVALTHV